MPQLFPPEMIEDTTETLFVKRKIRTNVVYVVVLLIVVFALAALPFVSVQISTLARGIIRTPN